METLFTDQQKQKIIRALLIFLFAATALLAVKTVKGLKEYSFIGQGVPATNTISVFGEGEVVAIPDIATFTASITEQAPVVSDAQELTTRKVDAALAYIREQGVEEKDFKTVGYNINPHYEYRQIVCITYPCPPGKSELTGYEVTQTIEVKVRVIANAGKLIGGLGELNVTNISGLTFDVDEKDALLRDAREEAISKAKEQAKELAKDLGVRLVRIVSYSDAGGPIYYPKAMALEAYGRGGADAAPTPEIPAGENIITSNVTIT